jgi:hypothetical protein
MFIKHCSGYELEKEKSNTSEDFFNRSEVTYITEGEEKTLYVLYLRYFDEVVSTFTPFENDPIYKAGTRDINLKDIIALACLLKNPELRNRKRVYINSEKEFATVLQGLDFNKMGEIFNHIEQQKEYEIRSSMEFMIQPA